MLVALFLTCVALLLFSATAYACEDGEPVYIIFTALPFAGCTFMAGMFWLQYFGTIG